MLSHRTTARGILFLLSLCGAAAVAAHAQGAKPQLVFPVIGPVTYGDDFAFPGSIRTQGVSGVPTTCVPLGANNVRAWVPSAVEE